MNGCELCDAARITPWYHEDDVCWVAECEACYLPMVVWRHHGTDPSPRDVDHMLDQLARAASRVLGHDDFSIDRTMRQIPDHFHAHARDRRRWRLR